MTLIVACCGGRRRRAQRLGMRRRRLEGVEFGQLVAAARRARRGRCSRASGWSSDVALASAAAPGQGLLDDDAAHRRQVVQRHVGEGRVQRVQAPAFAAAGTAGGRSIRRRTRPARSEPSRPGPSGSMMMISPSANSGAMLWPSTRSAKDSPPPQRAGGSGLGAAMARWHRRRRHSQHLGRRSAPPARRRRAARRRSARRRPPGRPGRSRSRCRTGRRASRRAICCAPSAASACVDSATSKLSSASDQARHWLAMKWPSRPRRQPEQRQRRRRVERQRMLDQALDRREGRCRRRQRPAAAGLRPARSRRIGPHTVTASPAFRPPPKTALRKGIGLVARR